MYDTEGKRKPVFASHPLWEGVAETQILADAVLKHLLFVMQNGIVQML